MNNTAVNHISYQNIGGYGLNIRDFLKIRGEISEDTQNKSKAFLTLKDETLKQLFEALVDRWTVCHFGPDTAYIKHVPSDRTNVLYQIILGGKYWDGIYEFALKGKKIYTKGYTANNKNVLSIESKGNYSLAVFGKKTPNPYSVSRCDFCTDEDFMIALLDTGLVSNEEMETYYQPDKGLREYLNCVLPEITFL